MVKSEPTIVTGEVILLTWIFEFFINYFLSCLGLLWLPIMGGDFWPFTDVLQEIRREVTRKNEKA